MRKKPVHASRNSRNPLIQNFSTCHYITVALSLAFKLYIKNLQKNIRSNVAYEYKKQIYT